MTVTDSFDASRWRAQLEALPAGGRIPAFFFAHGCTFLDPSSINTDDVSANVDLARTITGTIAG